MKTVNDLITELQQLTPELRELPVVIRAENGILMEAHSKLLSKKEDVFNPEGIIITYN